jgi:hypothetical protein
LTREEVTAVAFTGKELGDERLSEITGGRAMVGYIEHTVARGETLRIIADKYHVTERELFDMNHLHAGQALYIGQIVRVPVHVR